MIVTALMLVLAVPVMGLMFDGTLLFIIKSRLQGAVDGAALAAARGLARGADSTAQIAAAQAAAINSVHLNFVDNSFFTGTLTVPPPPIDLSVAFQRTVTVTASVAFPGMILKFITGPTTVNALAAVTRKDVNVVMVIDRSGSLQASGSCDPLKAAASGFVDQFASGRNNVGLVTFAFTSYVNFPLANTFQTANPNVKTLIGNINCAGSTSTAMGLWKGYQQLIALNQPGALNVLLLFTDGQPTAAVYNMPVANGSPCTAYTPGNPTGPGGYTLPAAAKGYITGLLSTYADANQFFGIHDYNGITVGGQQSITNGDMNPAPHSNGCAYVSNMNNLSDVVGVPTSDIFGNSTNTGYQGVTLDASGLISLSDSTNAPAVPLNAADSAATRNRNGVADPVNGGSLANVLIMCIGLGTAAAGPASPTFLERVSNDPRSPIFDSTTAGGTITMPRR